MFVGILANIRIPPPICCRNENDFVFNAKENPDVNQLISVFTWIPVSHDPAPEGAVSRTRRTVLEVCNEYPLFFHTFSTLTHGRLFFDPQRY